jgi:hypothetical protein
MIGDTYKNTIDSGKSDIVTYEINVPYWAKGHLTVTAVLKYRKLNRRYAKWALGDLADELPFVDMARDSLNIPLRMRATALDNLSSNQQFDSIQRNSKSTSLANTE